MEYLYEMHAHVKEVSTCSPTSAKEFVSLYTDTDYTGIVLTDHMNSDTFTKRGLGDAQWDKKLLEALRTDFQSENLVFDIKQPLRIKLVFKGLSGFPSQIEFHIQLECTRTLEILNEYLGT